MQEGQKEGHGKEKGKLLWRIKKCVVYIYIYIYIYKIRNKDSEEMQRSVGYILRSEFKIIASLWEEIVF
jgi:hypothetical protein